MALFVQLHLLVDRPLGRPNRGADGEPKSLVYGGVPRQRISSQNVKWGLRHATSLTRVTETGAVEPDTMEALAERLGLRMSLRSVNAVRQPLAARLKKRGVAPATADKLADAAQGVFRKKETAKSAPLVVGDVEIDVVANMAETAAAEDEPDKALTKALGKSPLVNPEAAGLDGALFGRFSTAEEIATVDGCVAVGHQFTVHRQTLTSDTFTATDDFAEGPGAAHLSSVTLGNGLFYGYVLVNADEAARNLNAGPDEVGEVVAWFVRALARANGDAGFGHGAVPEPHDIVAEWGRLQPVSGAGAFRSAMPLDASPEDAVARLIAHRADLDRRLGGLSRRQWSGVQATAMQPSLDVFAGEVGSGVTAAMSEVAQQAAE